jgi:SAM-dependent methyltransferase
VTSPRLDPPFWRHDAYTLRGLVRAVRRFAAARPACGGSGATVVDLGAGDAPYRSLFETDGAVYLACDLEPDAQVPIASGVPVPLASASADLVVSFQVLEHVWDLDWYLGEARRLLRDDGTLLLSTHGTWLYHPHPTDFRRWTRDGLVAELTTRGFEVQTIEGVVGPLAWTTQFRTLGYNVILGRIPGAGKLLSAIVCGLMYPRMWLEDRVTPRYWVDHNAAIYVVTATKTLPATESVSTS